MAEEFLLVAYLAVFGFLAAIPTIIIPYLFAPKRPNPLKLTTFEAGQVLTGEPRVSLMMQYYSYLLMFTVFDVLVMFLFAWAVSLEVLGLNSGLVIAVFLAIILIPMGYALLLAGRRELW